jgi:hypothetical protein
MDEELILANNNAQAAEPNTDLGIAAINPLLPPGVNRMVELPPGVQNVGFQEQPSGLNEIFDFYKMYSPTGLFLRGIGGLYNYLQGTDFARTSSLADYLDARSYGGVDARIRAIDQNMREARAIQKQMDLKTASGKYAADAARDAQMGGAGSGAQAAANAAAKRASQTAGTKSARGANFGQRFHG